jgi:DNA-binding response OmpR family regulator
MYNSKILLVDDDPAFCQFMERVLTPECAQVLVAASCQEALGAWRQEQPDLVILAVGPAGEEVFEACRQLRQRSHVPIIILSTLDHSEYVITALACGADDYIVRPFDLAVLRARIGAVLRRAGLTAPRSGGALPARI